MTVRQIKSSALLIVVLYNTIGFIATFNVVRQEWRQHIRTELASTFGQKAVSVFHFSKKEFNDNKDEFQVNRQWYDVVRIEQNKDSLTVYAFADAVETQLIADYHSLLLQNTEKDNNFPTKTKLLFKNLIKEFLFDSPLKKEPIILFCAILPPFCFYNSFPLTVFLPTDIPPPRFA
jgi:hypothetical protein